MEKFKWLLGDQEARKGPPLKRGMVYVAKDFPEHVVAEWVKTGAAEYVAEGGKARPRKEGE